MDSKTTPLLHSRDEYSFQDETSLGYRRFILVRLAIRQRTFLLTVILPTLLLAIYYFGFAADQYESEARFLIYSSQAPSSQMGGLGQMLGLGGGSGAASQTFSVIDYMQSHDAVGDLQRKIDLVSLFRRPDADLISRLWWRNPTNEHLLKYYKSKVTLTYREETGITTLDVHAFRPEDSLLIASTLLSFGEDRVNAYNVRVTADMVRVAQDEVGEAERRVESSEAAVTAFREQYGDVDPQASGTSGMELIAGLKDELSQTQMQLAQMHGFLSYQSPQVTTLRNRVAALQQQIASQSELLAGSQSGTLAPILAQYQDLSMRLQFAQQNYTATQTALETAREDAMKQQLFLVRVVEPNLPQTALFPRRLTIVGTFFAVLLVAYSIGWLMVAGVHEHIT